MGKVIRLVLAACVTVVVAAIAYPFVTFKDRRISTGEAYGFVVGETASQTYDRAMDQIRSGEVEAFELGKGSGAVVYDGNDTDSALSYENWQLVVNSEWWNNTIYLSFEDGNLVEIWRFRLCCELP